MCSTRKNPTSLNSQDTQALPQVAEQHHGIKARLTTTDRAFAGKTARYTQHVQKSLLHKAGQEPAACRTRISCQLSLHRHIQHESHRHHGQARTQFLPEEFCHSCPLRRLPHLKIAELQRHALHEVVLGLGGDHGHVFIPVQLSVPSGQELECPHQLAQQHLHRARQGKGRADSLPPACR